MFTRMDHVAISVKDMEKCINFYKDVIGMEMVSDRWYDHEIATIIGEERAKVRVVHMKLGDQILELFDYKYPVGRDPLPNAKQSDYGLIHIGFMVDDFSEAIKMLKEKDVKFLGELLEARPGVFVAYFWGAEHEVCEVRQIIPQ